MADAVRKWVDNAPTGKREVILRAALERFAHYGFRRTSMEDIAQEGGLSRAALYLHFKNKEEIFRALGQELHERAFAAAEAAARETTGVAAQLEAALAAKLGTFFEIVYSTAHARELLDENSRLNGEVSAAFRARHVKLLRGLIDAASRRGELAPATQGLTSTATAELLLDCAKGIETTGATPLTPADYQRRLSQLVRVVVAGLGGATKKRR